MHSGMDREGGWVEGGCLRIVAELSLRLCQAAELNGAERNLCYANPVFG